MFNIIFKLKRILRKQYRRCLFYIKKFLGLQSENIDIVQPVKKKKKKNESFAARRDHFAKSFGYIDYNDFRKKYCREALQGLIDIKPVLLVGKLVLDKDDKDKKFYTFVNIKPFCPGYEVKEICDHLNIAKKIVHRWYNVPIPEKDDGVYFVFECRINQYETTIIPKKPNLKVKRYGIDIVDEIRNIHPFFCAKREDMANSIPAHSYINFTASKLNKYIGRRLGYNNKKGVKIFQYADLDC